MKIEVIIPSSCDGSKTKLIIKNISNNEEALLVMIESTSGVEDIFVLKENLIKISQLFE